MTFIFVKEKTVPAIKEALVAGRTAIWFEKKVMGRREYLEALYKGAVRITDIQRESKVARFTITNASDLAIELQRDGKLGPGELSLPANAAARISVTGVGAEKPLELSFVASNFLIGPEKGLRVSFVVAGAPAAATAGN